MEWIKAIGAFSLLTLAIVVICYSTIYKATTVLGALAWFIAIFISMFMLFVIFTALSLRRNRK